MKAPQGSLVYRAGPYTVFYKVVAFVSLAIIFVLSFAYLVLIPAIAYGAYVHQHWFSIAFGLLLVVTVVWRRSSYWPAVGQSLMFEAWRRRHELRVWRKPGRVSTTGNVLLAMFPHGLFPLGLPMLSAIQYEVFAELPSFSHVRTAVSSNFLWVPLFGPLLRWLGCFPATKDELHAALRTDWVILLPDGIAGSYHSDSEAEQVYLAKRHGFIRSALIEGATLIPCFWFGHSQLWTVWPRQDSWIARFSRRIQFSFIWFWPIVPRPCPITLVVGDPIRVDAVANPTAEQIAHLHSQFTQAISALYYEYRLVAGISPTRPLLIV